MSFELWKVPDKYEKNQTYFGKMVTVVTRKTYRFVTDTQ